MIDRADSRGAGASDRDEVPEADALEQATEVPLDDEQAD